MPFAKLNHQEIFYEDSGGTGLPIVMLHGFLMDQSLFDPQLLELKDHYRCIRFDARAFGQTKWDGQAFSLYDTVADCLSLMDFLNIKSAVIMGMSQGGYAALRLALKAPERVKALVLMSTQAKLDSPENIKQMIGLRDAWALDSAREELINMLATILLGPKTKELEKVWETWLPKWRKVDKNAFFHACNNLNNRDDIEEQVKNIKIPALVSHGDSDMGMPIELGLELYNNLANAKKFVSIKGAAHAANFSHAELLNPALVEFLAGLENKPNA